MNISAVLEKKEGFTVRAMGDETLILDPHGSAIHVADEVGGFIYDRIDGVLPLSRVLEAILEVYDIDEETARKDLLSFVEKMVEQNILGIMP